MEIFSSCVSSLLRVNLHQSLLSFFFFLLRKNLSSQEFIQSSLELVVCLRPLFEEFLLTSIPIEEIGLC